jgi:hypothetical protein
MNIDISKWQILRCIYDYEGMFCIEVEEPERFEEYIKERGEDDVGHFIGVVHELEDKRKCAEVLLEGRIELLEFVMGKIKNNK